MCCVLLLHEAAASVAPLRRHTRRVNTNSIKNDMTRYTMVKMVRRRAWCIAAAVWPPPYQSSPAH